MKDGDKDAINTNELMMYLGTQEEVTPEQVESRLNTCITDIADEWRKKKPFTAEEVYNFYYETKLYVYDLYRWAHEDRMWSLLDKIAESGMKVLDYGCGIGDVAIYLAERGCEVTAVDLTSKDGKLTPCPTFHFAQWRVYARGISGAGPGLVKFNFNPAEESFDLVTCIDVLEHVHFPLRLVVQLGDLLPHRESALFITPRFGDGTGDYPQHLKANHWLQKEFYQAMASLAFEYETIDGDYFPTWHPVWRPYKEPAQAGGSDKSEEPPSTGSSDSSDSSGSGRTGSMPATVSP